MQDSAIKFRTVTSQNADHRPPADVFPDFVSPNYDILGDARFARAARFAATAIVRHRLSRYENNELVTSLLDDDNNPVLDENEKPIPVRFAPPSREEISEKKKGLKALRKPSAEESALKRELKKLRQSRSILKDKMDAGNPDPAHAYYSVGTEIAVKRDELETLKSERKDKAAAIKADLKYPKVKRREGRAFARSLAWHGIHPDAREMNDYISRLPWIGRSKTRKIAEKTFRLHHEAQMLEGLQYDKTLKGAKKVAVAGSPGAIERAAKIHRKILRAIDRDLATPLSRRVLAGAARLGRRLIDPPRPQWAERATQRAEMKLLAQERELEQDKQSLRAVRLEGYKESQEREQQRANTARYRASMRRARGLRRAGQREEAIEEFDAIAQSQDTETAEKHRRIRQEIERRLKQKPDDADEDMS